MIHLRSVLVLLLVGVFFPMAQGQTSDFPNPPTGQVLDSGQWLDEDRRRLLEDELGRYRKAYGFDVMVIVWDRPLPRDTDIDAFALRLGENWGRGELWALVLHIPDSLHRPAVVSGGIVSERLFEGAVDTAVQRGAARGLKERTTRAQVTSLAREVGEELAFLHHRRALEQRLFLAAREDGIARVKNRHQNMVRRAVIATLVALVGVATVAILYLRKRKLSECRFPDTRWRRRLGGEWTGGGAIAVSMPRES